MLSSLVSVFNCFYILCDYLADKQQIHIKHKQTTFKNFEYVIKSNFQFSFRILELLDIMCDEDRVEYFHDAEENMISTYCKGKKTTCIFTSY